MKRFLVAAVTGALLLSGCGSADAPSDGDTYSGSSVGGFNSSLASDDETPEREEFDQDLAQEKAEEEIADESYTGLGSPYGCTDDCSGHEAGFRWRADHGYQGFNADSPSFNEGGQAFDEAVEERVEEMRTSHEDGEDVDY